MFYNIIYHKIKNLNLENRIKIMPKPTWGRKVICPNADCGVRFYDLNRKYPLPCPTCGSDVEEANIGEGSSEAKKVFSNEIKSVNETNLVGSDATESIAADDNVEPIATDDNLPLEEVEEDETISLEEADQDVDVIDAEVDDLSIGQDGNSIEED